MVSQLFLRLSLCTSLLAAACSSSAPDLVQAKAPVKCFWHQAGSQGAANRRLAIVNTEIDVKHDPSHFQQGEVSRLSDKAMQIFLRELAGLGFFDAAVSTPPPGARKYVSVHTPSGNYYVGLTRQFEMANAYTKAVKAFTAYWSYGDTRFMTGSSTGKAPVDFKKIQALQEKRLRELRNRGR